MRLKSLKFTIALITFFAFANTANACHNVSVSQQSATDNGDGTYTYVFDFCKGIENTWGFYFTFGGSANVLSYTNSVTGPSTGATIFGSSPPISGVGDLEYGDWDNTGGTLWSGTANDCSSITVTFDGPITSVTIDGTQPAYAGGPCASATTNVTSCFLSTASYTVTINTDSYGGETSWRIRPLGGGASLATGSGYPSNSTIVIPVCIPTGCYEFLIQDSFGDGMCCAYGAGSYSVTNSSGSTVASGGSFGSSELTDISCQVAFSSEVIDFDGVRNKEFVDISWTSVSQVNNRQYILERSRDGIDFEPFHYEPGAGSTQATIKYSANMKDQWSEFEFFRLKQEDYDGNISTVQTIQVGPDQIATHPFTIRSVVLGSRGKNGSTELQVDAEYKTNVSVNVMSVDGQLMLVKGGITLYPGSNRFTLSPKMLESGMYIIQVYNAEYAAVKKVASTSLE